MKMWTNFSIETTNHSHLISNEVLWWSTELFRLSYDTNDERTFFFIIKLVCMRTTNEKQWNLSLVLLKIRLVHHIWQYQPTNSDIVNVEFADTADD